MTDSLLTVTAHLAEPYDSEHRVHLDALLGWALAPDRRIDARTPLDRLGELRLPLGSIDGVWLASATLPPLGDVMALRWLAWGHRRQVRSYIRSVTAIDRGSRQAGAAEVERWTIEAIDGHPAACLVRDGIAVRHMPEDWVDDDAELILGAARPPYWHPERQESVCGLGAAVRLQRWVRDELDGIAGEARGAHRPAKTDPAKPRTVYMTDAEWREVRRRADESGWTVSGYVRRRCLLD